MAKNELSHLKDIFKSVDDLNPDAAVLDAATLSTADDWIDTGSYALNAIISGSLYKGIPGGRITGFAGPSMAGKTLIMSKIILIIIITVINTVCYYCYSYDYYYYYYDYYYYYYYY
jgi:hypothetical protein